jgi:hypothetical protein
VSEFVEHVLEETSYYMAPEEMFEDPEAAGEWLRIACGAASRFGNRPPGRRKSALE